MNEWAVILGSSSGSGAAIATALANRPGLNILGIHRGNHTDGAESVRRTVEASGRRYVEIISDAGREPAIAQLAQQVREVVGPNGVKVFVHSIANASLGWLVRGPQLLHPKQIDKTFDSMAHSFVWWTRALYQGEMLAPEARILALTNAITDSTLANCSGIAAAKMALEMYVKYMASELGPLGYRVNALKYGTVETAALEWIFPADSWSRLKPVHDRMHPAGRMITTDEVGRFVSVLADADGAWFNGAIIDMTGGQMNSVYQVMCDEIVGKKSG